jgi:hypothetical protein
MCLRCIVRIDFLEKDTVLAERPREKPMNI